MSPTPYDNTVSGAEGWIEWSGGECPVQAETLVNLLCRDGDSSLTQPAGWCSWGHNLPGEHHGYDIIAYRTVQS